MSTEDRFTPPKVGDLLVNKYSHSKDVYKLVGIVTKVSKQKVGRGKWGITTYYVDVKLGNGLVKEHTYASGYITFDQSRERISNGITQLNKSIDKRYKQLEEVDKMEEKAKKIFAK